MKNDGQMLYLFPDRNQADYAIFAQTGSLLGEPQTGELAALPRTNGALTVLLSGVEVSLFTIEIPAKQRRQIVQAVPYSLEEQVAEDIESLHFVVGEREAEGQIAVAVIKQTALQDYLALLNGAGIKPNRILSAALVLPFPARGWSILIHEGLALVRTGWQSGFAIETSELKTFLNLMLAEETAAGKIPPTEIWLLLAETEPPLLSEADSLGIPLILKRQRHGAWAWFAEGLSNYTARRYPLNLLPSSTQQSGWLKPVWRRWRLTAVFLGLWLILQAAMQVVEVQQLKQRQQFLNAEIENIYRSTFPESKHVVNPRVQMERQLAALRSQNQARKTDQAEFLTLLNRVAPLLQRTKDIVIKRLDYQTSRLEVELELPDWQTLETFKQNLQAQGMSVETVFASSRAQGVESRLRVRSE